MAAIWEHSIDPYDVNDFSVDCTGILESGESISQYSLVVLPQSELLGLQIKSGGGYGPVVNGNIITMWLDILETEQGNPAFSGAGITLPFELNITTDSVPPRKKQRTLSVRVLQK